jgi:hypothetical protein
MLTYIHTHTHTSRINHSRNPKQNVPFDSCMAHIYLISDIPIHITHTVEVMLYTTYQLSTMVPLEAMEVEGSIIYILGAFLGLSWHILRMVVRSSGYLASQQRYNQPVLVAFLISIALLPQVLAQSCATNADCSFCGGYCKSPRLVCMCPASYCRSVGGECSFYNRYEDMRCQCPGGHFCGFWSGSSCTTPPVSSLIISLPACVHFCAQLTCGLSRFCFM